MSSTTGGLGTIDLVGKPNLTLSWEDQISLGQRIFTMQSILSGCIY